MRIDWSHIFIRRIERLSQPWVLLTCSAIISLNLSWSLNWKEESSTVGVFDTEYEVKYFRLFSGVHFDAKNSLEWFAFFWSHIATYHLLVREELEEPFCHYKMFSLLANKFWG